MTEALEVSKSTPPPAAEQRRLGRYSLRYRVAQGGMASVYLAQLGAAEGFHKWVALKTIHPHIATDRKFVRMFLNEARLAARIDHPNVCTVFDFGESDGTYYLAMEYLHGESLSAVARRAWSAAGLPLHLAARIVADAARGLHAAHELRTDDGRRAEVVHRDVSPQNVFVLYNGVSKVVDFGIARSNEHLGERTAVGELKGKVAYMSPEQMERDAVDRRTDVWALGVVLWEISVGRRLFRRENDARTIVAVLRDAIPRPTSVNPDYPRSLEAVVMKALERDPARRYATAADLARDLDVFLAGLGMPSGPTEVAEFMRATFGDLIEYRDNLLRRGSGVGGETAIVEVDVTTTSSVLPRSSRFPADRRDGGTPAMAARRASRWLLALGGVLLAGAGIAFATQYHRPAVHTDGRAPEQARATTTAAALAPPDIAAPVAAPAAVVERRPPAPAPNAATPIESPPAVAAPPPTAASATTATATTAAGHGPAPDSHSGGHRRHHGSRAATERVDLPVDEVSTESRTGYLNLIVVPSVQVFERGTRFGYTPLARYSLPVGRHTLRLVPTDGSDARTISVEIRPGEVTARSLRW